MTLHFFIIICVIFVLKEIFFLISIRRIIIIDLWLIMIIINFFWLNLRVFFELLFLWSSYNTFLKSLRMDVFKLLLRFITIYTLSLLLSCLNNLIFQLKIIFNLTSFHNTSKYFFLTWSAISTNLSIKILVIASMRISWLFFI